MSSERDSGEGKAVDHSVDRELILDLNFVPSWARKPPSISQYGAYDDDRPSGRSRDKRRGSPQRRHDRSERGDQRPARKSGGQRPDSGPGARGDQRGGRDEGRERIAHQAGGQISRPPSTVETAPVTVRFLPQQGALGSIVRQISSTHRAYPLMDVASLLLNQEGACFVRISAEAPKDVFQLHQCDLCQWVASSHDQVVMHLLQSHLGDFFECREIEVEPPKGAFVCVARCSLSGELLGPPNHHSYAEAVRSLHAERYAGMSLDAFKASIELCHEEDVIEKWRQEQTHKKVYVLKSLPEGEEGEGMSRSNAEYHLKTHVAEGHIRVTRRASLPETVARTISDPGLRSAIREEWQREQRFPLQLSFALRAAFRHKHLYLFKAGRGRGVNFVTGIQPSPLDPDVAIESIRDVLVYLHDHPGCNRAQLLEALRPGVVPDSDAAHELLKPLHWLIERGHIIEFFNGTLSVPLGTHRGAA